LEKRDIERIMEMHISPVNVSVHTTNPELRCKMMHNKRAGEVLEYLNMLADGGIDISAQIVLCRGINDGEELIKTLNDLAKLYPRLTSVAVVPSGLTKFRDKLFPLKPFDKKSSLEVIKTVKKINSKYRKQYGKNLFFCSDEFYLMANKRLPNDSYYEEYSQIENGVGMITSFETEAKAFIDTLTTEERMCHKRVSIATGAASYHLICKIVKMIKNKCMDFECDVYEILNDFFGHTITVSGLITGVDLLNQLSGKDLGEELHISRAMLRAEGDLFLCGKSLDELKKELNVEIIPDEQDGASFVASLLGIEEV
jgi:putative radical SAM enzyme (TIGR03279 family)